MQIIGMRKEQGQIKKSSPYIRSKQVMREYHRSERRKNEVSSMERKTKLTERNRLEEKKESMATESK